MSSTRVSLRIVDKVHRFQWQPHCPTDLQKWQTFRQTATHTDGIPEFPQTIIRKELQTSGVTSNNPTASQNKSARHPKSQSTTQNCQNHTFPVTQIPDRSSDTEVLARRLIGTCAQMIIIITTPPLIRVMPSSLITFPQLACRLEEIVGVAPVE